MHTTIATEQFIDFCNQMNIANEAVEIINDHGRRRLNLEYPLVPFITLDETLPIYLHFDKRYVHPSVVKKFAEHDLNVVNNNWDNFGKWLQKTVPIEYEKLTKKYTDDDFEHGLYHDLKLIKNTSEFLESIELTSLNYYACTSKRGFKSYVMYGTGSFNPFPTIDFKIKGDSVSYEIIGWG